MSLATRAGDLYFTFRFVNLLTTQWVDMEAYKLGIIDENGIRIKSKRLVTGEEKSSYTTFHRLVFNVKRLVNKIPAGRRQIASYATALFMLKEEYNLSNKSIEKISKEIGIDIHDLISEQNTWFLLDNGHIAQGIYRLKEEKVMIGVHDDLVQPNDRVRIDEGMTKPIGELYGLDIYEGIHTPTNRKVYFTLGEIYK